MSLIGQSWSILQDSESSKELSEEFARRVRSSLPIVKNRRFYKPFYRFFLSLLAYNIYTNHVHRKLPSNTNPIPKQKHTKLL